jgi:hypothetical protein
VSSGCEVWREARQIAGWLREWGYEDLFLDDATSPWCMAGVGIAIDRNAFVIPIHFTARRFSSEVATTAKAHADTSTPGDIELGACL